MSDRTEEYVIEDLRRALAEDPRVGELELEVRPAGGKIFISGTVATQERCRAIDEVAAEIAPGTTVCNEVTVTRYAPTPDPERLS